MDLPGQVSRGLKNKHNCSISVSFFIQYISSDRFPSFIDDIMHSNSTQTVGKHPTQRTVVDDSDLDSQGGPEANGSIRQSDTGA